MKLSVIIPSRNRVTNLLNTVHALMNQTLDKAEYEIIISDDNSNDDTFTEAYFDHRDEAGLHLKYVNNNTKPHSWNASVPRNLGALIADQTTTHFVFVDSDVILPPHALATYLEDITINPNRVIIGPYNFYKKGNEDIAVQDVRKAKFDQVNVEDTFDQATDGLACFGGNLVIPKDIFWSVRGFSTDTHIGLEDGDMGLKLWKKGVKFSYDKRCLGKHQWHETPSDRFPADMRQHIDKLNMKHFQTTDPDYGIIEASRDAYSEWGITGWEPPAEWLENKLDLGLKVNK